MAKTFLACEQCHRDLTFQKLKIPNDKNWIRVELTCKNPNCPVTYDSVYMQKSEAFKNTDLSEINVAGELI